MSKELRIKSELLNKVLEDSDHLRKIVFMTNLFVNKTNFTYDNGAIHEHMAEVKFINELVTFIEENVTRYK